jgi:hypothetical protein
MIDVLNIEKPGWLAPLAQHADLDDVEAATEAPL